MTVEEYINGKYRGKVRIITAREARVFGVPYPLRRGWFEVVRDVEITPQMAVALRREHEMTLAGNRKPARKFWSANALEALA